MYRFWYELPRVLSSTTPAHIIFCTYLDGYKKMYVAPTEDLSSTFCSA